MNIFDLDKALVDRYAAFARSFSTIKVADITEQVNAIYDLGKFWPDPLITINPHFEQGSSMDQLADDGVVDPALRQIFAFGHGVVNGFGWQGTALPLAPCCNGYASADTAIILSSTVVRRLPKL